MPRSVENIRPRKEQLADSHAGMWPREHSTGGDIVELPTVYMFIGRIARISLPSHLHPPDDREVVSDEFLEITRCLETGSPLRRASDELCQRVNAAIAAGKLCNRLGRKLSRVIDGGLVNSEGTLLYPILDDVPELLRDEVIELEELAKFETKC